MNQVPDLPPVTLAPLQEPELPPTVSAAPETPPSSPQPIKVAAATVAEPLPATTENTIAATEETLEEMLAKNPLKKELLVATLSNDPIVTQWKQIVFDKFQTGQNPKLLCV